MLYYNIIRQELGHWFGGFASDRAFMTHHHHHGTQHPSPAVAPSLLRLSASARLALAGLAIALIWTAALLATR